MKSPSALRLILHTGLHLIFPPLGTSEGGTSIQTWCTSMDFSSFVSPHSQHSLSYDAMATLQFLGSCALLFTRVARPQSGSPLSMMFNLALGLTGCTLCALAWASP